MGIDVTGLPCPPQDWLACCIDFGLAAQPTEPLDPNQAADRRMRAEEMARHILANWAMVSPERDRQRDEVFEALLGAARSLVKWDIMHLPDCVLCGMQGMSSTHKDSCPVMIAANAIMFAYDSGRTPSLVAKPKRRAHRATGRPPGTRPGSRLSAAHKKAIGRGVKRAVLRRNVLALDRTSDDTQARAAQDMLSEATAEGVQQEAAYARQQTHLGGGQTAAKEGEA